MSQPATSNEASVHRGRVGALVEVAAAFGVLGCLSFGGPIAHLGYLRREFVQRRGWLDDTHYADIVALCQFLPGPGSSQVVFALGMQRAGLAGALLASLCFTAPSALLMIAFAYGLAGVQGLTELGWVHGLKLAAVAAVAQAVWGMGRKLCADRARFSLCIAAAVILLTVGGALVQLLVIALGGLAGGYLFGGQEPVLRAAPQRVVGRTAAWACLGVFGLLLVGLPAVSAATGSRLWAEFDSFYRSSSLVFGGGHVVLPLLRQEVVPRAWLSDEQFLAGYGAAQALPGPLFAFAGYVGAAMTPGPWAWLNGLWCLLGIFLPAWLLIAGTLPFWQRLRAQAWARAAIAGANAAVVGVLLAALYDPLFTESIHGAADVAVALGAFALLEAWKVSPGVVVAMCAAVGQWLRAG